MLFEFPSDFPRGRDTTEGHSRLRFVCLTYNVITGGSTSRRTLGRHINLYVIADGWRVVGKRLVSSKKVVCFEGSVFLFKVLNVHPVLLTDKLKNSNKHAQRKFYENMAETSFLILVIVSIWSVTLTFYYFQCIFYIRKSLQLDFVLEKILVTQT